MSTVTWHLNGITVVCSECCERFGLFDDPEPPTQIDQLILDINAEMFGKVNCGSPVCFNEYVLPEDDVVPTNKSHERQNNE